MILIFGGAYQGKLEYAKERFDIVRVQDCRTVQPEAQGAPAYPDFSADAICGIEAFVSRCVEEGVEAADWFKERRDQWQDKVLIMRDQSQGIVPMDEKERAAREMCGRLMIYLASEAKQVIRVFCGIGKTIKETG